jgi:hypothetical protein
MQKLLSYVEQVSNQLKDTERAAGEWKDENYRYQALIEVLKQKEVTGKMLLRF